MSVYSSSKDCSLLSTGSDAIGADEGVAPVSDNDGRVCDVIGVSGVDDADGFFFKACLADLLEEVVVDLCEDDAVDAADDVVVGDVGTVGVVVDFPSVVGVADFVAV